LVEPVSVALNVGVIPETVLPKASFNVTVIVAAAMPLATVGPLDVNVEVVELAAPGIKAVVIAVEMAGVLTLTDFISALVDFNVQFEIPLASETEHVLIVLFEPVASRVGVSPEAAIPLFLIVT
jgi:hypothetical protein